MVKSLEGLIRVAEMLWEGDVEGERRVWDNFLAWVGDPDLTREKLWVLNFNYRQVQLQMSIVYLSGYDHQAAALFRSEERASCDALGYRFCSHQHRESDSH